MLTRTAQLPHAPLVADVISWGYAAAVIVAGLQFDVSMSLPLAVVVMAIFLALRAMARAIRLETRRSMANVGVSRS